MWMKLGRVSAESRVLLHRSRIATTATTTTTTTTTTTDDHDDV
jgi:hypothetical protein